MDLICHPNAQMNVPTSYLWLNDVFSLFVITECPGPELERMVLTKEDIKLEQEMEL